MKVNGHPTWWSNMACHDLNLSFCEVANLELYQARKSSADNPSCIKPGTVSSPELYQARNCIKPGIVSSPEVQTMPGIYGKSAEDDEINSFCIKIDDNAVTYLEVIGIWSDRFASQGNNTCRRFYSRWWVP
ncbi:hypothetical protein DPMN_143145 [Dreissena polymorpha]|uniref:Uncharacterized protein n=1 Tax=Dreissena polymorpha TaxID=45954 RepID=A0A9D4JJT6_DREPO|nr:hypothetical protein DPMN_143145 [Dreissena polymorpha]